MAKHLFSEGDLRNALEGHARDMEAEIAKAQEEHLLQADVDEWVTALADRYRVEVPELDRDSWWMEQPAEISFDPRGPGVHVIFDDSQVVRVPGFRVVVHVPFAGEADIFKFRPSEFELSPPAGAEIRSREVVVTVTYPADAPRDVKGEAEAVLARLDRWLGFARNDVEVFNQSLEQGARQAIQVRKQRVLNTYERLKDTGIPMRRPSGERKTYIADALVRRPSPSIPPASAAARSIELEPVLSDAVYEHILEVIRGAAEAMERSPKTYVGMGEEDRRQVLIAALNTHYRGQTTAEAFNMNGKTDILVRHAEGRNLFIGECKFWEGVKGFTATIDQLFGYAAWRDTKLAVVMFVGEKDLTSIGEKAREALAAHEQFVNWRQAALETELRATMSWPGDDRRHADLNVFFVHVPE